MFTGMNYRNKESEIIDFLFDLFDLFNFIIEVLRNLGEFLSRN